MHNGDDTEYYLYKGFDVVGIDANPELCDHCRRRFARAIDDGRLTILNIGVGDATGRASFHINRRESQISTFKAELDERDPWDVIEMQIVRLSDIIAERGTPVYVKIDVEHFDHLVLDDLRRASIKPRYISAEAHTEATFAALEAMGYRHFQLTPGAMVPQLYGSHDIKRLDGRTARYFFNPLSSGPFGDDLDGPWLSSEQLLQRLETQGYGWIDIHAFAPEA